MSLDGKVAVVTGAALGIGKAMTEILLQNGAKVALLDVNETAGKSLCEALMKQYGQEKTLFLSCDIQSEEQTKAALKKTSEVFGGIDILCNNAGILNENTWEKTVSINLAASSASGYGIRVNAVCPSFVQTELFANILDKLGQFSHLADATKGMVEKFGTLSVSQVAECLLELVTDETKNGEALVVTPQMKKYMTFVNTIQ
ncbi:-hydroxyprostaglandin dehydrogenase [Notolabrus celidotus] [Xyrichtys novacula]|uniref:-hydroxyprostaglandin dehydrogenase [Notolabrus celidotus] n=1 Tax=Xyrichtys novacula TaxID=13765 RepID=A0AAV1FRZ4_XYRNO|nr:-hydroxyprostaglandin dehydrogenase [Notolabrus celidotus] [Xyrichtys novacula]